MPLSIEQVIEIADLGLVPRTASAPLDRQIRWVAVSELPDPGPWLDGGEFLLTTGMTLDCGREAMDTYVARLVEADVAGLGFGVGMTHEAIPETLLEAAESRGLPVVEVPQPVPFVAVGKAVLRLLTEEEYADSSASFQAQRQLIRAVLAAEDPDVAASVVRLLSRQVRGFALVLDVTCDVRACHPPKEHERALDFQDEVERVRARGLTGSAAVVTSDEHVVILPIGVRGAAEGFLIVGSTRPLTNGDQAVINLAVSVLSWHGSSASEARGDVDAWHRLALGMIRRDGVHRQAMAELGRHGVDPAAARAFVIRGEDLHVCAQQLHRSPLVLAAATGRDRLTGICADPPPQVLVSLVDHPSVASIGLSHVTDVQVSENVRVAERQAEHAAFTGRGLREFGEGSVVSVMDLIDAATLREWALAWLGPLMTAAEGEELRTTLRAWLASSGQVDAAASELGIHRHTVRHRLRRAEALLGRSLDDARVRADLWQALSAVDTDRH